MTRGAVEWRVQLLGERRILEELAEASGTPTTRIELDQDTFLLVDERLAAIRDVREVRDRAREIVEAIAGAYRSLSGRVSALRVGNVFEYADGRRGKAYVFAEAAAVTFGAGPATFVLGKGEEEIIIRPMDRVLELISGTERASALETALRLMDRPEDWSTLYKVWEVISRDDETGKPEDNGWITKGQVNRFKHTANSPGALGRDARHGALPSKPPTDPMPFDEARRLIRRVFENWLRQKRRADT